jgi:hypothetical protein
MGQREVYQYAIPREQNPSLPLNRLLQPVLEPDLQPLTGMVQGLPATDIEERTARALHKMQVPFNFQVVVPVAGSLPGRGKVIDFLLHTRLYQPLEVDGPRWHTNAAQRGEDELRELLLNGVFRRRGWMALRRLSWLQLGSQAAADRSVRELLVGIFSLG